MGVITTQCTDLLQADEAASSRLLTDGGVASDGLQPAAGGALPLPWLCLLTASHRQGALQHPPPPPLPSPAITGARPTTM